MAKIIHGGTSTTIRIDNYLMTAEAVVGNLIEADGINPFFDADTGSSTVIDGILIPMIVPRNVIIDAPETAGIEILTAVDHMQCKGFRIVAITLASITNIRKKEKLSIGSEATIGAPTWDSPTRIGTVRVNKSSVHPGRTDTIFIELLDADNITTGDLVGEFIYETHQVGGGAQLGLIGLDLGQGLTGGKMRVALILTDDPSSGATYAVRETAGEVAWSRFYPAGSQVTIDLGGIFLGNQLYIPPAAALAPAAGHEKRLMLAFYLESGTVASTWTLNLDLTYIPQTAYEIN